MTAKALAGWLRVKCGLTIPEALQRAAVCRFAAAAGIDPGEAIDAIEAIVIRGVAAGAGAVRFDGARFVLKGDLVVEIEGLRAADKRRWRWRMGRGDENSGIRI